MKKILFLSLLFLLAGAFAASGQDKKHDIILTLGGPAGGLRYESIESNYGNDLAGLYKDAKSYSSSTALIAGYTYRLNDSFTVGADLSFGMYDLMVRPGASRDWHYQEYEGTVVSLMPVAEWYYYSDDACGFYMRAGVGAEFSNCEYDGSRLRTCWQLTPIGVHVGRKTYFVSELGIGTEYILRMGFGFRF